MPSDLTVKVEKWLIWGGLIGVIFLLRHLFPVIFFTFILSYIGNSVLNLVTERTRYRRTALIVLYLLFILGLLGVGTIIFPRIFDETREMARAYIAQGEEIEIAEAETALRLQEETGGRPPVPVERESHEARTLIERETRRYVDAAILRLLGRDALDTFKGSDGYGILVTRIEDSIAEFIPKIIGGVRDFVNSFVAVAFQFLLSIVLSFIILWDLPRLKESALGFRFGPTADVYDEIAPGIVAFGLMLGRAFEAQSVIAVVNAVLTSIGFIVLGIPSIALLGTIVFFCSYIPVFGVILSTLPAALLALKVGGLATVLWLIIIILVVHAIEAYGLNPLIYGHHMKIHPVAVLIILLVGEHLFGLWGLLLGVPIAAFFLRHVIRRELPDVPIESITSPGTKRNPIADDTWRPGKKR